MTTMTMGSSFGRSPITRPFLVLTMVPIVLLSKSMAKIVDHGIGVAGLPTGAWGPPRGDTRALARRVGGVQVGRANQLQRSVNISMGSALATISLTVPSVLIIGMVTGREVELGLEPLDMVLLALTLATMIVNASSQRTNVLQGVVHLTLFAAYLVLLFD